MALQLEFCSIVVRLDLISDKLGSDLLKDYKIINDFQWNDGHLWREGCMNEIDLNDILDAWEQRGFELLEIIEGQKNWKDVCIVNSGHGPSYPCSWIDYDKEKNICWLKGFPAGETVGPNRESS